MLTIASPDIVLWYWIKLKFPFASHLVNDKPMKEIKQHYNTFILFNISMKLSNNINIYTTTRKNWEPIKLDFYLLEDDCQWYIENSLRQTIVLFTYCLVVMLILEFCWHASPDIILWYSIKFKFPFATRLANDKPMKEIKIQCNIIF